MRSDGEIARRGRSTIGRAASLAVVWALTGCADAGAIDAGAIDGGGFDAAIDGAALADAAADAVDGAPPGDGATSTRTPDAGELADDAGPGPVDAAPLDAAALDAGTSTLADLDRDGLADTDEDRWAREYLPFLAVADNDGCPRQAIAYRVRPHPSRADRLLIVMVNLFETDCGAAGHVGDNEVFSLTVDPSQRGPTGILALRAIAHQATACEEVTDCGRCAGLAACDLRQRRGQLYPTVHFSTGKHGAYLSEAACDRSCFFTNFCTPPASPVEPPMINVGEPAAPLVRDLTAAGVITATAGWSEPSLFGFDPWGGLEFGGAGNVTDDLTDEAFHTPACGP